MIEPYPIEEPYNSGILKVSTLHKIYFEESGNPGGKPVVYIHGGPGGKSKPKHRSYFDPKKYRIILFDQRGCGLSTPLGEIRENSTWDLLEDMEKIRERLGIESWMLFAGSWGSTLALAYAERYPNRVSDLLVRGVFLFDESSINWFVRDVKTIFPDAWDKINETINNLDESNPAHDMYKRYNSGELQVKRNIAYALSIWEWGMSSMRPEEIKFTKDDITEEDIASAGIMLHYIENKGFFEPDQLINEAINLPQVRTTIIHGRYDMICPLEQAWKLHKAIPYADFHIVPDAGHHSSEPGTLDLLLKYSKEYSD